MSQIEKKTLSSPIHILGTNLNDIFVFDSFFDFHTHTSNKAFSASQNGSIKFNL